MIDSDQLLKMRKSYYQLKAQTAIFSQTNQEQEYSRFQHLEKAESQAHIDGVLAVVRRAQIDELTLCHRVSVQGGKKDKK